MNDSHRTFLVFGGFGAAVLLIIYLVGIWTDSSKLDRSAIGTRGLVIWLQDQQIETKKSHRHVDLNTKGISLRILPLYDAKIDDDYSTYFFDEPSNKAERLAQETQRSIHKKIVETKLSEVKTLVVLPKWRTGVNELGVAHKSLLISWEKISDIPQQIGIRGLDINEHGKGMTTLRVSNSENTVQLYAPQLFSENAFGTKCTPYLKTDQGVLVAHCAHPGNTGMGVYVLSDPDLINNHGLSLADNSIAALNLIKRLRSDSGLPVYHDVSTELFLANDTRSDEEPEMDPRTFEDLARFFVYPFSILWLSAGLLLAVALWRGLIRFGPVLHVFDDQIEASKTTSIKAKAFLLRLANQDHALAAEFASNQMTDLAISLLGPKTKYNQELFHQRLRKLVPEAANEFLSAADALINGTPSDPNLYGRIENFNTQYRRVSDAIGSISRYN